MSNLRLNRQEGGRLLKFVGIHAPREDDLAQQHLHQRPVDGAGRPGIHCEHVLQRQTALSEQTHGLGEERAARHELCTVAEHGQGVAMLEIENAEEQRQEPNSGRWKEAQQMRTVGGQGPHLLRTASKLHH